MERNTKLTIFRNSFDPTPRIKSSPIPILFIPFYDCDTCKYCKSECSKTSAGQSFCKNCFFDYVKNLTDDNTYLDVHIRTRKICSEHGSRNLYSNIREWCKNCTEILHFNQIVSNLPYNSSRITKSDYKMNFYAKLHKKSYKTRNIITKCKLCGYEQSNTDFSLCPNCYLISYEWIESTFEKKPIPILYLPWWDASGQCIACRKHLIFKSDYQKWCFRCFIIYIGCIYCLTTNIIFGITKQSECKKCKRVITIDITNIERYLKAFLGFARIMNINNHHRIVNYMNKIKIDQISNLVDSVYNFLQGFEYDRYYYRRPSNNVDFYLINTNRKIGFISFIPFNNNITMCYYCQKSYSTTLIFEQKYCKYCLYWYIKELTDKAIYLDVHISETSNTYCTKHESRSFDFCTQNIREWCMNCSEILYFKQTITRYSFDMNYYYEKQNEISKYERNYKLHQFTLNDTEIGWIESTLTEKTIPILNLSWWYSNEQCIVCKHILNDISIPLSIKTLIEVSDYNKKWCSNCFTIYIGCRYCLTTNIIFGFTNQSKCKKCKRISFISIDTENITENFIIFTKINADNFKQIVDYINNNQNSSLLEISSFISKVNYFDLKYISYSNLKNNENFPIPIIFIPYNNNEEICHHCKNRYSVTLLFQQKYCKYCLSWYIKFTDFKAQTILDVYISTKNTQCSEHEPRNLNFCTNNTQEWCINFSEISYFNQIITQYSDMKKQSEITQSKNCNLCGSLIHQQISLMCSNCYSVSSGYIKSKLTKKIPILYLPWWDASSSCMACRQNLEYKSNYQKWCSCCYTIYIGCEYCLTTNIIFGFTNQSQCIKCKRVSLIDINGNHIISESLNSAVIINDEIANYMNNINKDNNPLNVYNFIKDKFMIIKNIKIIEYSETGDFKKIAKGGFGIIYKATCKMDLEDNKIVAVKRFLNSQNISKDFVNEVNYILFLLFLYYYYYIYIN
jgi:hypothetical protein